MYVRVCVGCACVCVGCVLGVWVCVFCVCVSVLGVCVRVCWVRGCVCVCVWCVCVLGAWVCVRVCVGWVGGWGGVFGIENVPTVHVDVVNGGEAVFHPRVLVDGLEDALAPVPVHLVPGDAVPDDVITSAHTSAAGHTHIHPRTQARAHQHLLPLAHIHHTAPNDRSHTLVCVDISTHM